MEIDKLLDKLDLLHIELIPDFINYEESKNISHFLIFGGSISPNLLKYKPINNRELVKAFNFPLSYHKYLSGKENLFISDRSFKTFIWVLLNKIPSTIINEFLNICLTNYLNYLDINWDKINYTFSEQNSNDSTNIQPDFADDILNNFYQLIHSNKKYFLSNPEKFLKCLKLDQGLTRIYKLLGKNNIPNRYLIASSENLILYQILIYHDEPLKALITTEHNDPVIKLVKRQLEEEIYSYVLQICKDKNLIKNFLSDNRFYVCLLENYKKDVFNSNGFLFDISKV